MITFSDNLFISEKLKKNQKHLINKLRAGDTDTHFYVVYKNGENGKAEMMHSVYFRNKLFQVMNLEVHGITATKPEAVKVLAGLYADMNDLILEDDEDSD